MSISEIGLSGHSASGVQVDANMQTSIPGLYAAGDMANVPHNYMIGALSQGELLLSMLSTPFRIWIILSLILLS